MLHITTLLALTCLGIVSRADVCPSAVLDIPNGIVPDTSPLVISGSTTYPCSFLYIYIFEKFWTFVASSGSEELGANQTFSWQDDLNLPPGDLKISIQAADQFNVLETNFGAPFTITYGHSGCPEPQIYSYHFGTDSYGHPAIVAGGDSFMYFGGDVARLGRLWTGWSGRTWSCSCTGTEAGRLP
jgi:hypothetical protein